MEKYYGHIRDIIRNNFSWSTASDIDENQLLARLEVTVQPDGQIALIKILKPSGNRNFDGAVISAIQLSHPLPQLPKGKPVLEIALNFRPRDLRQ